MVGLTSQASWAALLLVFGVAGTCHSEDRVGQRMVSSTATSGAVKEGESVSAAIFLSQAFTDSPADRERKIQQSRAFWQSILVPGLGQIASGRTNAGYAFLTVEVALVGSLFGLRTYASRLEEDYRVFAGQHAGVSRDRDHQYYVDIGNWPNERTYNDQRLRDRDFEAMYLDPDMRWQWDNDGNRASFKTMRLDSDQARNDALMVVGGLILNHLFSAIDAARGSTEPQKVSLRVLLGGGAMLGYSFFPY